MIYMEKVRDQIRQDESKADEVVGLLLGFDFDQERIDELTAPLFSRAEDLRRAISIVSGALGISVSADDLYMDGLRRRGADGMYQSDTEKITLDRDLVGSIQGNFKRVVHVIAHELGHKISFAAAKARGMNFGHLGKTVVEGFTDLFARVKMGTPESQASYHSDVSHVIGGLSSAGISVSTGLDWFRRGRVDKISEVFR